MKKLILLIFSIILLTGCSNRTSEKEVTFWTLQMGDFAPYINSIISEYENNNPKIKIKWIDVPYSEGEKRTLASIMSNNPPDLVNLNPDFSIMLAQIGALKTFDKSELEQFNSQIINLLTNNDKYFGIPFYATSSITYINKGRVDKK
jgi:putative chitobiose transport system substrate-binding protein